MKIYKIESQRLKSRFSGKQQEMRNEQMRGKTFRIVLIHTAPHALHNRLKQSTNATEMSTVATINKHG